MNRKFTLIVLLVFIALFFTSSTFGDTVYMKDGTVIKGKIIEETDKYIKIVIGREGAQITSTIQKRKIQRIVRSSEEKGEPSPTPAESSNTIEKAIEYANAAIADFEKKDFDSYLRNITKMMVATAKLDNFKEAYELLEKSQKKPLAGLLEKEMKRPCNQVVHFKPGYRMCSRCRGSGKIEKTEKGKKRRVKCPVCKGLGGTSCPTCVKRWKLAKKFRQHVRYTKEELKHIAYVVVRYKAISEKVRDRMLQTAFKGYSKYVLEEKAGYIQYELQLKKETVTQFAERLAVSGLSFSRSKTNTNNFTIRIK